MYRGGKSEFPIINPYMVSKYLQDRVQCPAGALQAWTRLDTSLGLFLDHGLIVCTSLSPTNSIFRPWPYCVHYCVHYRVHYRVHMQVHLQVHMQALFLPGCRCTCRIYGKLYSATTVHTENKNCSPYFNPKLQNHAQSHFLILRL